MLVFPHVNSPFHLKDTARLLSGASKLPTLLLERFGAVVRWSKGDQTTSTVCDT